MGEIMGMEWLYDLDGLSKEGYHVSVARKYYTGPVNFDPNSYGDNLLKPQVVHVYSGTKNKQVMMSVQQMLNVICGGLSNGGDTWKVNVKSVLDSLEKSGAVGLVEG